MYRILVYKNNMPKDTWQFYKKATTTIDEDTGETVKTTVLYEAETLEELVEEYTKLLETYTAANVLPVDMLKVNMNITIEDETSE